MPKIKILRIIARLNIGGPAIHTILLTEGLDRDRFESILVSGTEERDEGSMSYLAEKKGVSPVIIPELGRALNIRDDFIAFWKIFRLINSEKPDIIHTHTAKAGTLGRLAGMFYNLLSVFSFRPSSKKKRCILVHTFHGHVLHSYFGRVKTAFFIRIERFLALFTDRIIVLSSHLKEELVKLKLAGREKFVTVPLGLELEGFLNLENDFSSRGNCKSVGIIGRLVPVKNHRMFLEAARKLKDRLKSGQKVKFLVVGDGLLRRELEDYAERLGIKEDVIFTGWLKDLAPVYSGLDVAALTSLNEGTPVALIEAQSAGCACVATRVGGVADVVEHGSSGYLVSSGDTDAFAGRLLELLDNPELMRRMGSCGRERVRSRFCRERLIADIEDLYQQITAKAD